MMILEDLPLWGLNLRKKNIDKLDVTAQFARDTANITNGWYNVFIISRIQKYICR